MKKSILSVMFVALMIAACSGVAPGTNECPTGDVVCGTVCCDPTHYSCGKNTCILTSCDQNFEMCHGNCVPFPSDCCSDGSYCFTSQCGSNHTCFPIGSNDCGNGRYCPFGHICLNGGNNCS